MTLDDFLRLAKAGDYEVPDNDDEKQYDENTWITTCYAYSLQTRIDCVNDKKAFLMNFVEFLEAMARVAYWYSPQKINQQQEHDNQGRPKEIMYDTRFTDFKPAEKLESMCKILMLKVCDKKLHDCFFKVPGVS
jgi:hypothetical protein